MTPTAQLDILYERMLGLFVLGAAEPLPKLAEGTAEAERLRGEWFRRMVGRCESLHKDYVAFMRKQVEEAQRPAPTKEEKPPEKRPAPTANGSAPASVAVVQGVKR